VQDLGGIRDSAPAVNRQEGTQGVAIHIQSMQKAGVIGNINKFV
jgi:hypothetical protein